jgi:hypothetical protein
MRDRSGSVERALMRRDQVAGRVDTLAHEAAKRDPALAALLARLADAEVALARLGPWRPMPALAAGRLRKCWPGGSPITV